MGPSPWKLECQRLNGSVCRAARAGDTSSGTCESVNAFLEQVGLKELGDFSHLTRRLHGAEAAQRARSQGTPLITPPETPSHSLPCDPMCRDSCSSALTELASSILRQLSAKTNTEGRRRKAAGLPLSTLLGRARAWGPAGRLKRGLAPSHSGLLYHRSFPGHSALLTPKLSASLFPPFG